MARSIGDLGYRRDPVELEFGYFGATIRVHPAASDTVELEFLDIGKGIDIDALTEKNLDELDEGEQFAAFAAVNKAVRSGYLLIKDSLRQMIHPEDWDTYWRLARENGQRIADLMTDLKRITTAVVEADTGFPTMPPSASDGGQGSTPRKSADGSSSVAARPRSDADKALAMLRSRPDLQEFVVMQEESAAAKAARTTATGTTAASRLLAAGHS